LSKLLIIQENGRHDANRHMRECFSLQHGLASHGIESIIWGLGHDNFSIPFEDIVADCDAILSIENYDTGWMPSLADIKKTKLFWSIDSHCALRQHQHFCHHAKIDILLNSTPHYNQFYSNLVKKRVWFPNAVDLRWFSPLECEKKHDVGFCGSLIHDRKQWLNTIHQQLPVRVGTGILGRAMIEEVNSYRVSLNKSIDIDIPYRVFEMTACRLPLVTNYVPNLERLYELGKEIEVYQTVEELIATTTRLLENEEERHALAQAGYARTLRDHNYEIRARQLVGLF